MSRRPPLRHQPIADGLRANPGEWGRVGNYGWRPSAQGAAAGIRTGRLIPYQPAGSFETEIRVGRDGDSIVYARYIGQPAPQ